MEEVENFYTEGKEVKFYAPGDSGDQKLWSGRIRGIVSTGYAIIGKIFIVELDEQSKNDFYLDYSCIAIPEISIIYPKRI